MPHFRSSSTTKERQLTAHFGNSKDYERPISLGKDINRSVDFPQSQGTELYNKSSFELSLENVDVDVKTVRIDKPDEQVEDVKK